MARLNDYRRCVQQVLERGCITFEWQIPPWRPFRSRSSSLRLEMLHNFPSVNTLHLRTATQWLCTPGAV
jgi:hypothetical protein